MDLALGEVKVGSGRRCSANPGCELTQTAVDELRRSGCARDRLALPAHLSGPGGELPLDLVHPLEMGGKEPAGKAEVQPQDFRSGRQRFRAQTEAHYVTRSPTVSTSERIERLATRGETARGLPSSG